MAISTALVFTSTMHLYKFAYFVNYKNDKHEWIK